MNNLEKLHSESKNIAEFSKKYFNYLAEILNNLDSDKIAEFTATLEEARTGDKTIFVIGNGGSAATASHIGNDLGMIMMKVNNEDKPFKVLPLTDNVSIMTAIANDYGFEDMFYKQLKIHFQPGDIVIAISASGNSPNLIKAVDYVNENGGKSLGILGFDGGKLGNICNVPLIVKTPKGEYAPVEDVHMVIDHMLTTWFQVKYKK